MRPFLGISGPAHEIGAARVVVLPVPYERTVSYGGGTREGPAAVLEASAQVELYDDELGFDLTQRIGIATAPPLCGEDPPPAGPEMVAALEREVGRHLDAGRWVLAIGGEHSITPGPVAAHAKRRPDLSVLQIDAHLDLREAYEGDPHSHASAMARVVERGVPVVGVGIRNVAEEEVPAMRGARYRCFPAREVVGRPVAGEDGWVERVVEALSDDVYVTFDVDGLDPGVVPGTGTPEPGGLSWYEATALLRAVAARRRIVGADVVETAPVPGERVSEFAAARLAYKILCYALGSGR